MTFKELNEADKAAVLDFLIEGNSQADLAEQIVELISTHEPEEFEALLIDARKDAQDYSA